MSVNKALIWVMLIVASWVTVWLAFKSLTWIWLAVSQTLTVGVIVLILWLVWKGLRSVKSSNEFEV